MKMFFCLSDKIMLVNDNAALSQIPQIVSTIRTVGKNYKIVDVVYNLDENEIKVKSSEYVDYVISAVKKRKANNVTR